MKYIIAYFVAILVAVILLGSYVHRNVEEGVKTLQVHKAAVADLEKR